MMQRKDEIKSEQDNRTHSCPPPSFSSLYFYGAGADQHYPDEKEADKEHPSSSKHFAIDLAFHDFRWTVFKTAHEINMFHTRLLAKAVTGRFSRPVPSKPSLTFTFASLPKKLYGIKAYFQVSTSEKMKREREREREKKREKKKKKRKKGRREGKEGGGRGGGGCGFARAQSKGENCQLAKHGDKRHLFYYFS